MGRDEEPGAVAIAQLYLVRVGRHRAVRDRAQSVARRIAAGQHRKHTGAADRPCHINARNRRMRVRRTHETCIGLAREAEVVGVLATAGQQSRVLAPRHRFSDAPRGKRLA